MTDHLLWSRKLIRRVTCVLLPPFLILISFSILAIQFKEISTRSEILSLTSFITLISFSALAFNWCRVSSSLTSEDILKLVYQVGIDLFLASLLALVSTFFAWVKMTASFIPTTFYPLLFGLHWLFLLMAILLFLFCMLCLLRAIRDINSTKQDAAANP